MLFDGAPIVVDVVAVPAIVIDGGTAVIVLVFPLGTGSVPVLFADAKTIFEKSVELIITVLPATAL